jgi:hypothetical protein
MSLFRVRVLMVVRVFMVVRVLMVVRVFMVVRILMRMPMAVVFSMNMGHCAVMGVGDHRSIV